MPNLPVPARSRRGFLAAGAALGIGALVVGCGDDTSDDAANAGAPAAGSGAPTAGGAWTFQDDRGKTVSTKKTPKKIVAFVGTAAVLHDYGIECAGVFGPTKTADGKPDVQAGELDVAKVKVLGNQWGEFSIENYAALQPDLLVSPMYDKDALWYVPDDSKDKILAVAPSVALNVARVSLPEPLRRHAELAASLGADLNAAKAADAKKRFEAAAETLRQAAKAAGGLTVMAASGSPDLFYVSAPDPSADLRYFKELGVEFVLPKNLDPQGYFEGLSWEAAGTYRADVIMLDNRSTALQPKDLAGKPTWNELPAVKAGQVVPWVSEPRFSYAGCAPLLEQLAATLQKARKLS
ncbi:ABC transporter substrate-binding protein [Yinghuangia seranimata]|uniref:ABC transporter substrate-binding protein n=1 Tax=Yinghuangia seranimata TaxID=408067 RepID=UPI00248B8FD2|nr:ABC transporter substrate-binding protein [Yinghuangia seranimata]MDI2129656.1 ABC transporter substrate-binding protein [Yinghuangia seranimata]